MRSRDRGMLAMGFAALLFAGAAQAKPLEPPLQKQLLDLVERYNKAIFAGKVDDAMVARSEETRTMMRQELADPKKRREFLEFAKLTIPDKFEIVHTNLTEDGSRASIVAIATKKIPEDAKVGAEDPKPGSTVRNEMTYEFLLEEGAWKYDNQTLGIDPAEIAPCQNVAFEPLSAYDDRETTSIGGPIRRVDFKSDHTLVVVRIVDEENCAFLPDRAKLEQMGFDPARLVPYAVVNIAAFPHKTDKQKFWVDELDVQPE
jgi:hypothetical protein